MFLESGLVFQGLEGDVDTPPVIIYSSAKNGLPAEEVTWAKVLSNNGYRTGAFGKNQRWQGKNQ